MFASGVLRGFLAALVARHLCGKHISAAMSQQATIEEAVFTVGPSRDYNEDLTQPESELSRVPELAVTAEN
jgi:hypothetical protein